jgi:hypothetical protein
VTKADQVRALLEDGRLPDKAIAERVGCHIGYVRAVRMRSTEDGREIARAYCRDYYWSKRIATSEAREKYNAYHRDRRAIRKAATP